MKDFDQRILELGQWIKPHGPAGELRYYLNSKPKRRPDKKPWCSGEYPYCQRSMMIEMVHVTQPNKHKSNQVRLRCQLCSRGELVDCAQWRVDVAKSKKSE